MRRRLRCLDLVVLVVLVVMVSAVAACGGGDVASTPTTTTSPSSTTTPTTTIDGPVAATGCDDAGDPDAPGADAASVDAVPLDADGDGLEDRASVVVVGDNALELVVDHGAGGRAVLVVDGDSVLTLADVRVDQVADVDDDGDDDVWLVVGSGASTEVVSLVLSDGCTLVRPSADGAPNAFAVGASIGFTSGVECTAADATGPAGFWSHEGENSGADTYRGTSTRWRVEEGDLVRDATASFEIEASDGSLQGYASLRCV